MRSRRISTRKLYRIIKNKNNLSSIAYICAVLILPAPAVATTLQEAVNIAITGHPVVQGAQAGAKSAAEDVDIEWAGYLPTLDLKGATGYENVNSPSTRVRTDRGAPGLKTIHKQTDVTLAQTLFDGFNTSSRVASANKRQEAAGMQVSDAQETVALRVARSYIAVLRSRILLQLGEENITDHQKVFDDISAKAAGGAGSTADVDQARSRLALAKTRLVQARGALREAEAKYREAVGGAPDNLQLPGIVDARVPETAEEVVTASLTHAPAVQAAARTADSKGEDIEASRSTFWPTVSLEAVESRQDDVSGTEGLSLSTTAMLVMRYNLYRGGADLAKTRRALEQESQARMKEAELKRSLESQALTDHSAYEVARENLPTLEKRMKSAADVVGAYKSQFDIGRRSLLDLLDSEDEFYQARSGYVTGKFALMDAIYRLHSSMGGLVRFIGDQPAIDPAGGTLELPRAKLGAATPPAADANPFGAPMIAH